MMGVEKTNKIIKLYIRLPVKITDEQQIKNLHPSISKVSLPRQKSRRWCIVDFESQIDAKSAIKELKQCKIGEKSIFVNLHKDKQLIKRKTKQN